MATLPGSSTPSRKVKEPWVQVLTVVMMSCVALIGNFLSWDTVLLLNWSPASKMIHLKGEKSEMNHAKIWTRYFTEEITQMDSSHMKDYAASLIIRKTTQCAYHSIPIKMAKMEKDSFRCVWALMTCWWECHWHKHFKNYSAFSVKVEDVHPLWPRNSTSRYTCNRNAQKSAPERQAWFYSEQHHL